MIVEGRPTTAAASDRFAFELDLVQYDHGEGPCVTALGGQTVRVGFIPNDERWPHFAIGPADRRVQSVLSVPAPESGPVAASLNVYSRKAEAFDGAAQDLARVRRRDRDRAGHVAAVQRGSHGRGSFAGTARRGLPGVDGPGHLDVHS
jgi:hypothetical protein